MNIKVWLKNWKTTIGGVGMLLVALSFALGYEEDPSVVFERIDQIAAVIGSILAAFGFTAGGDADRTDPQA